MRSADKDDMHVGVASATAVAVSADSAVWSAP
jgi:hypothetical protein